MTHLILESLTPFAGYVRLHDSGDFFNADYFGAWLDAVRQRPRTLFYAYTKRCCHSGSSGWTRSAPATSQATSRIWC